MSKPVRVVVKVVARADAIGDIRSIVLALAEKSRSENGCASDAVIQNLAEPGNLPSRRRMESIAALEAHDKTPHFHEAVAKSVSVSRQAA